MTKSFDTRIKSKICLPDYPANPLLYIYIIESKIYVHRKSCTRRFLTVLFTVAQNWKKPNVKFDIFIYSCNITLHSNKNYKYRYLQPHRCIVKKKITLWWAKEARHKRVHTTWCHSVNSRIQIKETQDNILGWKQYSVSTWMVVTWVCIQLSKFIYVHCSVNVCAFYFIHTSVKIYIILWHFYLWL